MATPGLRALPLSNALTNNFTEQRLHPRLNAIGQVARIDALGVVGLARINNLSDGGAQIAISATLANESPVRISFDSTNSLQGRVVWSAHGRIGIRLLRPIDCAGFIGGVKSGRWSSTIRAPRLPANSLGRVKSTAGSFATIVSDVSEKGLKLCLGGDLPAGTSVEVTLQRGMTLLGTVRWSDNNYAGIELSGKIAVDDLANTREF